MMSAESGVASINVCAPYSVSLVKRGDHGRRVFRHQSHQQLEHVVDVLVLPREAGGTTGEWSRWRKSGATDQKRVKRRKRGIYG